MVQKLPCDLPLQVLHRPVALCVEPNLRLHQVVEMLQMVGLDGGEALHQKLGDLHLLVVLSLGSTKLVLSLGLKKNSFLKM